MERLEILRRAFDGFSDPFILIRGNDHLVVVANLAAGGVTSEGRPCYRIFHGESAPCSGSQHPCSIERLRSTGQGMVVEHLHECPGAPARIVEIHAYPVYDEHGELEFIAELSHDVTEKKEDQAELAHSDRLITVGMLLAGVTHELNSPLSFLKSNLTWGLELIGKHMLSERDLDLAALEAMLKDCVEGTARIEGIICALRTLTQAQAGRGSIRLDEVVAAAAKIARCEFKHRAEIVLELGNLPEVSGNAAELAQVFLNLMVNAGQAMDDGPASEHLLRVVGRHDQERVFIELHDSGCGIAPEHFSRIFDPFFTTKDRTKGTGLGLYLCRRIVESHGGSLTAASQADVGSTFVVSLPF